MQPLGIYFQPLLHFCLDGIERELGRALHIYTDLLYTANRSYVLEHLKPFHFTFHRKRMALARPRRRLPTDDPCPPGLPSNGNWQQEDIRKSLH